MLGKLLQGRYLVIQLLSAGGFCQIYLAKDTCRPDHRTCVVKHLLPTSTQTESVQTLKHLFAREAEALKKLNCYDQVPRLLDCFEENFEFYLVQEFIEGRLLSTEMPRGFHWSESFVVQLLQDVLSSLQVVHSHGLIHGDIKPSNLIRRHQDERLVLIDFGCVKQAWTQIVTAPAKNTTFTDVIPPTIVVGTPGYMPPEQVRGFPRPNSDIYALGMIAIQALTGLHPKQLPEGLETGEILWQQHARISIQLTHVLEKMVCYHFKKRYQSAIEVLEALQPLTITDKLTQHLEFSGGKATSAQRLETATRKRPISLFEQDTILGSEALLDISTSDTVHLTSTKKSILLMGIAIGVTTVLASTVGIYYLLQPPPPASPVQQNSLSRQAKVMTR